MTDINTILETFTKNDHRAAWAKHFLATSIMDKAIDNPEINKILHTGLLPPSLIKNKSILDFGCNFFLTGAWSLYHDAQEVLGIEIDELMSGKASRLMSNFFQEKWEVKNTSIESYISQNNKKYDIILIAGTIHAITEKYLFLNWCINHCDYIIIESNYPPCIHYLLDMAKWWDNETHSTYQKIFNDNDKKMFQQLLSDSEYSEWIMDFMKNTIPLNEIKRNFEYTNPSFYNYFFQRKGWKSENYHSNYLTENLSDYFQFPRRYCVAYSKVL